MNKSDTTLPRRVKKWFRRFSWKAGIVDAIRRINEEQQWANQNKNVARDLEMQYAANSLRYLLNRGFE